MPHPAAARYLPTLGLQLWTVRNQIEGDRAGVLRAIQAAGYAQVELMRTDDAVPITAEARALGLQATSSFLDFNLLANPTATSTAGLAATLGLARTLGLKYLVFGYIPKGVRETTAHMRGHAARANAFGRHCRDAGIQLCYHHHAFEFEPLTDAPAMTGWDVFVQELDPAYVQFELDVFWAAIAGFDPVAMIRALRGRITQVHLKDLARGTPRLFDEGNIPPDAFKEVGAGGLDWPAILTACAETGVAQCHVEQDQSPDPLASLAASARFLRQL